ncbi:hypothetical protein ACDX78_19090 [Virgibacillus oceani]
MKRDVLEKYNLAKQSVQLIEKSASYSAISNRLPEYNAENMSFGTYKEDEFVALFADMRGSTKRGKNLGSIGTFLTIHAVMPTLVYIVEAYGGYVIDHHGGCIWK